MKPTHFKNTLVIALLWGAFSFNLIGQVQMQVKTFNSFKPAKEKVQAIEQGLADVQQQIGDQQSSQNISKDISLLERMVGDIRKDFKRYKKLPGWDEQIAGFKVENAKIKEAEEKKATEERLAAEAEKKHKKAISEVNRILQRTNIEGDIKYFKSNPNFDRAKELLDDWPSISEKLSVYQSSYPGENDFPAIQKALDIESYIKGDFKSEALRIFKNKVSKDDPTIDRIWEEYPGNAIKMLADRLSFAKKISDQFSEEKARLAPQIEKDDIRYKSLFDYRDGGGHDAWKLDQVRIDPPEGRDATAESHIRKALTKEGFEVVVVSMRDANWYISKNQYGIPEYKAKGAVVGVRKDGKCQRIFGTYRKSYSGGGTYNSAAYFRWNDPKDMNCKNLK